MRILFFSDAHTKPGTNMRRFEALGNMIAEHQPGAIVQGGDFSSFDSLSHFDRYRARLKEGRRYSKEIAVTQEAIDTMCAPIHEMQEEQRRKKEKLYKPVLIWILGNHENRVQRYVDEFPEVEDIMDPIKQIRWPQNMFEKIVIVPWKECIYLHDISFTHAIIGKTGPIHSKYICARALAEVHHTSVVFGHSHFKQEYTTYRRHPNGLVEMRSVCGGWFGDPDEEPEYMEGNTADWWRGLLMLDVFAPGRFDVTEVSMDRLLAIYGPKSGEEDA